MAITYNTNKVNPSHVYRTTGGGTTFSANLVGSGNFDFFTDTFAINDAFYVGKSAGAYFTWSDVDFNIGTALTGVGVTGIWEYVKNNTKTWTPMERFIDETNGFTVTGKKSLKFAYQDSWNSQTINGVTGSWIRYRITGFTSRTKGGSNVTDKLLIGDGVVNVLDYTDASPCTLKIIHDYMLDNYSYTQPINTGNYFDMRWFSVDMKSPTVSYNEILEIGTDMQGQLNLRSYWKFDYWTTGYKVGDGHGKQGSKIFINSITNSYTFAFTANQKSYGASYFSTKFNSGYPNFYGTFYDCLLQLAPGGLGDGVDIQNCVFEIGFGFIASTWTDNATFKNNTFLVTGSYAWSCYNRGFNIYSPNLIFDTGTKYLLGSQQNNADSYQYNFIDPVAPLPGVTGNIQIMNMPRPTTPADILKAFYHDVSSDTYTDITTQCNSTGGLRFDGDVGDCYYFSILTTSSALQHLDFGIQSGDNDYEYILEYYKTGYWLPFSHQWDETENFTKSGAIWVERGAGQTTTLTINGTAGFYYRVRVITKGTKTTVIDRVNRFTRAGTATWRASEKYSINYSARYGLGSPLEGVRVAITDKFGDLQFSGVSDVSGEVPKDTVTTRYWYFDPLDPNKSARHETVEKGLNPFIFKSRKYGYAFREIETTVNDTQSPVNQFLVNPNVVADEATACAYTGIAIDHTTNTITINEDHTMQELYDYSQYDAQENIEYDAAYVTADGNTFFSTYDLILDGCKLSGNATISMVVNSVTYLNGATSEVTIVADDGTHTNIKLTNIIDGSRIQLYDIDSDIELFNNTNGTELIFPIIWTEDRDIRIRVSYVNVVTAKKWYETTATLTSSGINLRIDQEDDTVYNEIAIDGSTVEECSIDGTNLIIDIDDDDAHTSGQRIYAFEVYWLSTEDGIRDQALYIEAIDSTRFEFEGGLKIKNVSANPLTIDNCNIYPSEGLATDVFDLTGNTIFLNSKIVVPFAHNVNGATEAQFEELIGKTNILDRKVDDTQTRVITLTE